MSNISITKALKIAADQHSPLWRFGRQWKFTYKINERNWSESMPADFFTARRRLARSIAGAALAALGRNDDWRADAWLEDAAGTARDMVTAYLAKYPTPRG